MICKGQLGLIHMFKESPINDLAEAEEHLLDCEKKLRIKLTEPASPVKKQNKATKNKEFTSIAHLKRVHLDCLMCKAYIKFEWHEWEECATLFKQAHLVSTFFYF